jgi:hypothetical protein
MNKPLLVAACVAASAFLAGCQSEPIDVSNQRDPQAEALANRPPVELPPALVTRTYRCTDNSLVHIDFSGTTAVVRVGEDGERTTLTAPAEGQAFTADGYSVSANADDIQFKAPGQSELSCRAHNR